MSSSEASTRPSRAHPLDKNETISAVAEHILAALDAVEKAARSSLEVPSGSISSVLIRPSNPMVGEMKPERFMFAQDSEVRAQLRRLLIEPFVARVEVEWLSDRRLVQTYYFPRRSAAGMTDVIKGALFVTQGMALGALAEHEAGEIAQIYVGGREREGRILKRTVIEPMQRHGLWDALASEFEAMPWGEILELLRGTSLRGLLDRIKAEVDDVVGRLLKEAADAEAGRQRTRRAVVDRIALRDRAILDKFQGEIFRLPLDRQVILFGPPGSGKTTTLIKRLAQKRTPDALTDREQGLLSGYVREQLSRSDGWAMFSPAELLKQYLSDAFNKQGVPDHDNVRMWSTERFDLARNVLNILRSNSGGRFQLESNDTVLADPSSPGIAKLHDEFAAYAEASLLRRCNDALAALMNASDEQVRQTVLALRRILRGSAELDLPDVFRLLDNAGELQGEVRRLNEDILDEIQRIANVLLRTHTTVLNEIAAALPAIKAEEDEQAEEDGDEELGAAPPNPTVEALNVLMATLRNWARAVSEGRQTIGGQSGRTIQLIKSRLPPDSRFVGIGAKIALAMHLRTLVQAPRRFVFGIPTLYARFRREALRNGRHFVPGRATVEFFNGNRVSPDELDILIFIMLRNTRRVIDSPGGERLDVVTQHDWLERIKSRYLMQVFVDEATDLSSVQLACTAELTYPKLRSWFACGDLRQRITFNGLQNADELAWLNRTTGINVDIRNIDIGYRQSRRLRELSDALALLLDPGHRATTHPPRESDEADVWPLLGEGLAEHDLAVWLADRIKEVDASVGRLPSTAVFVDGDDRIDPLVEATNDLLAERSIPIVGCKEGRVKGDEREVRVFDIRHIKGMEFEAVFFVDIDALARRIPELFQRFLYVGITRAATYLGVTCEARLPTRLEPIRSRFRTAGWVGH